MDGTWPSRTWQKWYEVPVQCLPRRSTQCHADFMGHTGVSKQWHFYAQYWYAVNLYLSPQTTRGTWAYVCEHWHKNATASADKLDVSGRVRLNHVKKSNRKATKNWEMGPTVLHGLHKDHVTLQILENIVKFNGVVKSAACHGIYSNLHQTSRNERQFHRRHIMHTAH